MSGFDSFTLAIKRFIQYLHTDYRYLRHYKSFLFDFKIILFGFKLPIFNGYSFGEGFIHAFRDKAVAQNCIKGSVYSFNQIVIKGYIPAFTRYQIGRDDICARKMIFPNI